MDAGAHPPREDPGALPYLSPGSFARRRFGGTVFRVVVDAGFSCPGRDGTIGSRGCLFCSVAGFRPPSARAELPLEEQIARALPRLTRRFPGAVGYLVYFQPYTNTHADPETLAARLAQARRAPGSRGVVLGTRPDALPEPILDLLARTARETFLQVELGVQSTDDATLEIMDRGHTWETSRRALAALRERGVRAGAHVILGTPWESRASQIRGAELLSAAGVAAVKLHHLQIQRGSRLADLWPQAGWELPGWSAYAALAADFLERLDASVVVERLCARTPAEHLIAPRWEASPARVRDEICRTLIARGRRQGSRAAAAPATTPPPDPESPPR